MGANGVPNKLFIAVLFSDHDVGIQFFLWMLGWFQAVRWGVSADHKCPGVSALVLRTVTDGDVGWPYLLPHAVLQPQLGTVLGNVNFMEVLLLTYDIVRRVPADTIQQEH